MIPTVTSPGEIPTPEAVTPATQSASIDQGRRVALVIGNAAYKNAGILANPVRDAEAVAKSLRSIGFASVTLAKDASRQQMVGALRGFAAEAEQADWALIYFAGHGVEIDGINYLLPVDTKLASDTDAQFEAVPLDHALVAMERAKKLRLVLLDACRNNPFVRAMRRTIDASARTAATNTQEATILRSVGLAEVKLSAISGTLVFYAAKHGQTALDGIGGNSPFVVALVQRLATPGVEINKIFRLVRDDVMEATAGRQEPYTYGSLSGREDFFFMASK